MRSLPMKFFSKPLIISALMFSLSYPATAAENYKLDPAHTAVTWQVNHMGYSNPTGKFMDIDGVLVLDEQAPENSTLNVKILMPSGKSGVEKLDEHLMKADFFDIAKYPEATFKSTKVEPLGGKNAKVTGDLTLHGVTKPVILDVVLNNIGTPEMTKKKTAGFSATTVIKRSDFGISYGIPLVSDEVKISIEAEANIVE